MKIEDIMTKDVLALHPKDTVSKAIQKLAEQHVSGAPVVSDDGQVVGMVTETDILNALKKKCKRFRMVYPSLSMVSVSFIECFDDKEIVDAFKQVASTKVSEMMTKQVVTAAKDFELGEVVQLMNDKKVNRVPVVSGKKLVGIVSRADIIRGLAKLHSL
jgi:CBS domain-containing protein